jgi:endonuclease/exonuclease/phosphatase family metal-dependent hydrolase
MKWPILLLCFFTFNAIASLKMTSFNIRNFGLKGTTTNKTELKNIISQLDTDIIAVQEIVNTQDFKLFIQKEFPDYSIVFSHCGGGGKQKLGFIYHRQKFDLIKLEEDVKISQADGLPTILGCGNLRPALIGTFRNKFNQTEFTAVIVHLKAGSGLKNFQVRWKQYKYLNTLIAKFKMPQNVILFGDFNTTGFMGQDEDYFKFEQMLKDMQKQTVSHAIDCTSYWEGAYPSNGLMEPAILDHIVYSSNFLQMHTEKIEVHSHCAKVACQRVPSRELGISYSSVSDHCPVTVSFK